MEFLTQNPSGKILAEIHVDFHVGFSRENRMENIDPYRSIQEYGLSGSSAKSYLEIHTEPYSFTNFLVNPSKCGLKFCMEFQTEHNI